MPKNVPIRQEPLFPTRRSLGILLAVLLIGGFCRFFNPNWDFQHSFHPDERNILGQTSSIQASSGYRVQFFAYGQLPVYLYRATGEVLSTPAVFQQVFRNDVLALGAYWLFLALVFAGLLSVFRRGFGGLSAYVINAFLFSFLALWSFAPLVSGQGFSGMGLLLTLGLAGAAAFLVKTLREESSPVFDHSLASFVFVGFLIYKFFPIFTLWVRALDEHPAKGANFVLVVVVAFGASLLASRSLGWEWIEKPFYGFAAAVFLLGIAPLFLPVVLAQTFAVLSFVLLVGTAAFVWALLSKWGRWTVALLAFWTLLASLNHGGRQFTGYGECMILGRLWAAFFSTATILAVYALVQRVYRKEGMALLAAAFFAFSAVSIEQAHYCITESFITFMFVVVALASSRIIREGNWTNYLLAGTAFGLSMAAKTSSLYYLFVLVTAHLVSLAQTPKAEWEKRDKAARGEKDQNSILGAFLLAAIFLAFVGVGYKFRGVMADLFQRDPGTGNGIWIVLFVLLAALGGWLTAWGIKEFRAFRGQMPQWIKLMAAGGLSFLLFILLSPWSLLDLTGFLNSQNYEWDVVSHADACYVLQFKDTFRYLFHLKNLMSVELWWPLGVTAVLGAAWALFRFGRGLAFPTRKGGLLPVPFSQGLGFDLYLPDLLVLCWFIPYFGFIGCWNTKFIRYMVPLVPAFCIFGAGLLSDLFARTKKFPWGKGLRSLLVTVVAGASLVYSIAYLHVYYAPNPWIDASVWIYKNIPPGSMILTETWDDGLPTGVDPNQDPRMDRPMNPGMYRQEGMTVYELHGFPTDNTDIKKNYYADMLQKGEYISLASKKLWYTLTASTPEFRPNGFNVYPVTSRYYRCLWSGLLGYQMVGEFHNFPGILGWEHPDDMAEESFSVYDHPRVYLFKKVADVPRERILKLLGSDDYVKGIDRDLMRTIDPKNVASFIEERKRYLESKGLWADLMVAAPASAEALTGKPPVPPSPGAKGPAKPGKPAKPAIEPAANAAPRVSPTPDIPIVTPPTVPGLPSASTLKALEDLSKDPVVETSLPEGPAPQETAGYLWTAWIGWLSLLLLLGWLALPWTLRLMAPMPQGAFSLSKILGFFLFAWAVWFSASLKVLRFTQGACWGWFLLLAVLSAASYWRDRKRLSDLWSKWGRAWLHQEAAFIGAFALFSLVKTFMPHVHDPVGEGYNGGGEAGMDLGFLSTVVRGESFPPQNMWMAGTPISYSFYYGHLMMGILTKFLGLVPAVTYNLGLITLFSLVFSGAFGLAYGLSNRRVSGWIAGVLCALAGNPSSAWQLLEALRQGFGSFFNRMVNYDYFGPSRVIPNSINEFPYFSVLYGDMHAHTLAMPFAMLLMGILLCLYIQGSGKPFDWKTDLPRWFALALLFGGVSYSNTWEVPAWLVLLTMVLWVRGIPALGEKGFLSGFGSLLACLAGCLALLGWVSSFMQGMDGQVLGGKTAWTVGAFGAAAVAALLIGLARRSTTAFSRLLLHTGLTLGIVLSLMGVLWAPYFLKAFHPQQSEILWVPPALRSDLGDFLGIFGLFVLVLVFSFLVSEKAAVASWLQKEDKRKGSFDLFVEKALKALDGFTKPQGPVGRAMFLGVASLALVWGASWVHWAGQPNRSWAALGLGLAGAVLLGFAVLTRRSAAAWLGLAGVGIVWSLLMALRVIPLYQEEGIGLRLGLFSVLWLLAFWFLGIALKRIADRALSASYLIVSFFFFIVATLEIWVMREYLGGEWLRNNTLFKFYIVAWEVAAVATGAFLPSILEAIGELLSKVKKESKSARPVLWIVSFLLSYGVVKGFLGGFFREVNPTYGAIAASLALVGLGIWGWMEGWFGKAWARFGLAPLGSLLLALCLLTLVPADFGSILYPLQHWSGSLQGTLVLPVLVAFLANGLGWTWGEGRRDIGRSLFKWNWTTLLVLLTLSCLCYPVLATNRKCHGFLSSIRRSWTGSAEPLTLNGLEYIAKANPYDGAAIRFLNDRVPGQPCLAEFVGEGYNSWGSRFSIFTGIPALMGWDGHVREWVTGRPALGEDVTQRFQATEDIFRSLDPVHTKKVLDAYGVRLVMVGTVERNGVPGRKGGYPPEGLAKFSGFLRLIYRNPQVEIYYNPPSK